ncbi:MAG: glycosyltransferase family 4 protein [Bacteroidales bacterium]
MKIAFDAKRATHNGTGLGNYSRFVLNTLSAHNPENEYLLYTPSKGKANLRSKVNEGLNMHYHYPKGLWNNFGVKSIWRSFGVVASVNNENTDIYHGLSNEIPFGIGKSGVKSVVTIHDLIFLRYPEYYKPIDRAIYKFKFKRACQKADRIIAVSEMTKRDIINFFGIPSNKIDVVYQGCDNSFKSAVPESFKPTIRKIYGLPEEFILSVGTIEARKNLLLAVKALKASGKKYHLVAIGKPTPYMAKVKEFIQENNMEDQVTFLHNVPFAHLPAIYQMASLFVYPSFFEGFGIPVIEALYSKVPVIAATGSCLEEAGGDYSVYVDPVNHLEMAEAINDIWNNPARREEMIKHGLEHVKKFEEENIAIELQEVYSRVVEKKS